MERITFDQLPEMVALILEKLEQIEALIGADDNNEHIGKEMLTVDEAVKFMGLSKSSLYKMSADRTLPVYKPNGKKIYFKKDDLINFIKQNRVMSRQEIEQEAINTL